MTGDELRNIRMSWGMSQAEFGRALGYTVKSIANYERGRKPVTESLEKHILAVDTLKRIKSKLENIA